MLQTLLNSWSPAPKPNMLRSVWDQISNHNVRALLGVAEMKPLLPDSYQVESPDLARGRNGSSKWNANRLLLFPGEPLGAIVSHRAPSLAYLPYFGGRLSLPA